MKFYLLSFDNTTTNILVQFSQDKSFTLQDLASLLCGMDRGKGCGKSFGRSSLAIHVSMPTIPMPTIVILNKVVPQPLKHQLEVPPQLSLRHLQLHQIRVVP
ncbi:hypothetical protein AABB24_002693 [Solanum stoloniferum]|uniref:Uncharacterized protein n=1 Tax=Solanum stoloniferum TaxID=62892 RepID=A0ABD2V3W7_9SOLN